MSTYEVTNKANPQGKTTLFHLPVLPPPFSKKKEREKREKPPTAFSLLVYIRQPLSTRLFLKKSRTSLNPTVQSRS